MNNVCVEHDWSWYEGDDYGCPVCYGIRLERERIIALLETQSENWSGDCEKPLDPEHCQSCWLFVDLIALINGENE